MGDEKGQIKRLKLGEFFIAEGLLTEEGLEQALHEQKTMESRLPIGEVCVRLKLVSRSDLRMILRKHMGHIPIGQLLVNMGIVTEGQVDMALETQKRVKKRLGDVLIGAGFLNEDQLVNALSIQLGIPKIIPDINLIDKKLLKGITPAFLLNEVAIPAFREGDVLTVILADPLNEVAVSNLKNFFGCKIETAIATATEIKNALNTYYKKLEFGPDGTEPEANIEVEVKDLVIKNSDLAKTDKSIIDVLNYIISRAIREEASDIHIEPMEKVLRIRYRIDGIMTHKTDLPSYMTQPLVTRTKVLCGLDIAERRRHQDGRIAAKVMGKEVDLRVSSYAAMWGENIVIRILHRQSVHVDIDMLGFSPYNMKRFRQILNHPSGMMLVTGPTGSGKTTTLYAAMQYLNSMSKMIITVEDPVEYAIEGVVQGKLNPKLGQSYMDFLKSMMRQDPDVLMIGEIRDRDAAEAAIQAALTGHQVFTTFHTDDATGALLRLMDMGIDTFLISSTVVSIVSQRLIRVLCSRCKEVYVPGKEILAAFSLKPGDTGSFIFYRAKGCKECNRTGYKGRTGIHELLVVNDAVRDVILARGTSGHIRSIARKTAGLISLREDGFYKAATGVTSLEEVVRVVFYNEGDLLMPRTAEEIVALCEGDASLARDAEPAAQPAQTVGVVNADESEFYRVRFDLDAIDSDTAAIRRLFGEYKEMAEKTGKTIDGEKMDAFVNFVKESAMRLRTEKGADYADISLHIRDAMPKIYMELETLYKDKGA